MTPITDVLLRGVLDQPAESGTPDRRRSLDVLIELCGCLSEVHARGELCHLVSPDEIWLEGGATNRIKLRVAEDAHVAPGLPPRAIRALGYLAPEVLRDGPVSDPRADLFSLGAVLYEAITGQRAFPGQSPLEVKLATLDCAPRPPRELCGCDAALDALCLRLLAKEPEQRPKSAAEVAAALRSFVERNAPGLSPVERAPDAAAEGPTRTEEPGAPVLPRRPSGRTSSTKRSGAAASAG